jgi:phosphoribosylamine---glycine ligase
MKIGIIGSGGREHALCHFLFKSKKVNKIFCIPGNAGTDTIAQNLSIDLHNFEEIKKAIIKNKIDFIIVGPEKPLVDGLVDYLKKYNIKVFGPNKTASQLEGSKIFTKELCKKYNIPTAKFRICKNLNDAINFLSNTTFPMVIKADGLASGKGVYIPENKNEGAQAIKEIFDGKFGKADQVLIEEFLDGEEMSYFIISDGKSYKKFQTAQDHKRVFEGDIGKNTGGMGAYSPSKLINEELDKKILKKIIEPTLSGLNDLGVSYEGFLYAGLMIKNNEPYLIEYNVRMGDPECQVILPKLENDLFDVIKSCIDKNLESLNLRWSENKSLCVVLCSKGYPEKFKNEVLVKNLNILKINKDKNEFLFHAGTKIIDGKTYSNGGRVLNFVKMSDSYKKSREDIIKIIKNLNWENGFFRKDIGHRVIDS